MGNVMLFINMTFFFALGMGAASSCPLGKRYSGQPDPMRWLWWLLWGNALNIKKLNTLETHSNIEIKV